MKRSLPAITAALALSVTSAVAADLPSQKAPPPVYVPPPAQWTGLYLGLNLGGGWLANNNNNNDYGVFVDPNFTFGSVVAGTPNLFFLPGNNGNNNNNTGGVIGGGQAGYNYQFGTSIVIGAEADIQGTSISNNNSNYLTVYPSPLAGGSVLVPLGANIAGNVGVPWFGTVRGRAGWLITPTLLLYGTAGFAYGGVQVRGVTGNTTSAGWTAGGGVEWLFLPNWSAKLEYLYIDLTSNGYDNNNWGWGYAYSNHPQLNVVRAGVNYHFNSAAPAPVVAKY